MKALIFDLETTGLDHEKDQVTEFACLIWEPIPDRIVEVMTARVAVSNFDVQKYPEDVERITDIRKDELDTGIHQEGFQGWMKKHIDKVDWVIAHNAPFDCGFLRFPIETPIMNSATAIPRSASRKSNSLGAIAEFHRIRRPYGAHRAIFDVMTLYEVLRLYNWDLLVERANSPQVREVVDMSYDEFKETPEEEKPKAFGFKWDQEQKVWYRDVLECDLRPSKFPFPTQLVHEA